MVFLFIRETKLNRLFSVVLASFLLTGCLFDFSRKQPSNEDSILIKLDDKSLYQQDISYDNVFYQMSGQDSSRLTKQYIEDWMYKQWILDQTEGEEYIEKKKEIEKIVENYRLELLKKEYEDLSIARQLDSTIDNNELLEYYKNNQADFELKNNIVRLDYLKIPLEVEKKKLQEARKYLRNNMMDTSGYRSFRNIYCVDYISNESWIDYRLLVEKMPKNFMNMNVIRVKAGRYFEEQDSSYLTICRIREVKMIDENSPFSFVKDQIMRTILYRRKLQILEDQRNKAIEEMKALID